MRQLIRVLAIWMTALAPFSSAQQVEQPTFDLEAIYLVNNRPAPEIYFQDVEGNYIQLKLAGRRGQVNQVLPKSPLKLYKKGVGEDGKEIFEEALSMRLPVNDGRAILLFYMDEVGKVQYQILEDPDDKHPGGSLRIYNLSNQAITCLVDQDRLDINPNSEKIVDVLNGQKRFNFAFGLLKPTPYRSPIKTLPMRTDQHRLLVVFSYEERLLYDELGEPYKVIVPEANRMYDQL